MTCIKIPQSSEISEGFFSIDIYFIYLCAQCSPRHACLLYGWVLMQVHGWRQAAPVLVREGQQEAKNCMQSHAANACMAFSGKMAGI